MSKKTAISNILVIPHSPTVWVYYINDGDRHAVSEKVITNILSEIAPTHVYSIYNRMSRSLGFFIDIEKNEFHEVNYDNEEILRDIKRKNALRLEDIILSRNKNKIAGQKEKESIINKFARKQV